MRMLHSTTLKTSAIYQKYQSHSVEASLPPGILSADCRTRRQEGFSLIDGINRSEPAIMTGGVGGGGGAAADSRLWKRREGIAPR